MGRNALRMALVRAQKFAPRTIFCFRGFIKFLCYNLCMDPDQNKKSATDEAAADLPPEVMGGIVSPNPKAVHDFNPDVHQAEKPVAAPAASTMAVAHEPQVGATADNPLTKFDLERAQAQEKAKAEAAARAPKAASAETEAPAPAPAVASRPAAPAAAPSRPVQPLTTMPAAAPAVQSQPAVPAQPVTPASAANQPAVPAPPVPPAQSATPAPQPAPPTQPAPVQMPPAQFPTQSAAPADHGDIILGSGDSPKKNFNPILIAGIAVGVILVVVIAVLGLMNLNKNSGSESAGPVDGASFTREETIAAWNKFFNYLYSGTADTGVAPLPEDIETLGFAVDQSVAPMGEDAAAYITQANELYAPLQDALSNHFPDALTDWETFKTAYTTVATISVLPNLRAPELIAQYYQVAAEDLDNVDAPAVRQAVLGYVAETYASLNVENNEYLRTYYDAELFYAGQVLDNMSFVYIYPCLTDEGLDASCSADLLIQDNQELTVPMDAAMIISGLLTTIHESSAKINRLVNSDFFTQSAVEETE